MTRTDLRRATYRLILHIHPAAFRDRFAEEMLWIFDEESRNGNSTRLLIDGTISAVRQHIQGHDISEGTRSAFATGLVTSTIGPGRILQAGLLASLLTYSFFLLLAHHGTYKLPKADMDACSSHLSAPYRISSPPKPPPKLGKQ